VGPALGVALVVPAAPLHAHFRASASGRRSAQPTGAQVRRGREVPRSSHLFASCGSGARVAARLACCGDRSDIDIRSSPVNADNLPAVRAAT
jgi:hypothetical protein